jgi:stearoyl-CoA desaturase (delta-9 desaturase)
VASVPGYLVAVLVGLTTCQVGLYLTTVVLHRALSHRAITISRRPLWACRALIWLTTGIRPREWVAVHRKHHAFTDVEGDPHSPILYGFLAIQLGNVVYYKRAASDAETIRRYAKDLPPDRWDRVVFDHGFLGLGAGLGILFLVFWGSWQLALIAAGVHIVSYLLASSAINAIGHRFGKRPYAGNATNNQWLAWLVAGEGLHSNHHAAPTSARLSFEPSEIDPGWWVIALARRLGWVQVRHSDVRLTARASLAATGGTR